MKKTLLVLSIATVGLLAGCGEKAPSDATMQPTQVLTVTQQVQNGDMPASPTKNSIEKKNKKLEKPTYSYDITYPYFGVAGVDEQINMFTNDKIQELVDDAPKTQAESAGPYSLTITYETSQYSNDIVSVVFTVDTYTGGAHPNMNFVTFTFNLKTQKEMQFPDVFVLNNKSTLSMLSTKAVAELKKQMGDDADEKMIETGAAPKIDNFQNFSLDSSNVTFYFDPYAVAPYAAGPQKVTFALQDLSAILTDLFKGQSQGSSTGNTGKLATGYIEGSMGYPSEGIPKEIVVCADSVDDTWNQCTDVRIENKKFQYGIGYELQVPIGEYYVYEKFNKPVSGVGYPNDYKAYYSQYVLCGMKVGCESHEPIKVTVKQGETYSGVNPQDWYVDTDSVSQ